MRKFSMAIAMVAGLAVAAGCSQVGGLKAKMAFKDANQLYQAQDYRKAAEKYEEALQADPNLTAAYFFLGNSYDNLYKPARKGEAANDELLTKAIDNYKKAAEMEQDPKIKKLALEYLVAAYGPDEWGSPKVCAISCAYAHRPAQPASQVVRMARGAPPTTIVLVPPNDAGMGKANWKLTPENAAMSTSAAAAAAQSPASRGRSHRVESPCSQ